MKIIELDASRWPTALDFYDALLAGLGAPDWHGISVDAFIDSIIYGNINSVEPPYKIAVTGLDKASNEVFDKLAVTFACLAQAGAEAYFQGNHAWLEVRHIREPDLCIF